MTGLKAAARPAEVGPAAAAPKPIRNRPPALSLHICSDLAAAEPEWRRFERFADCTPFQTFDWIASWHRHVGARAGALPAVVIGRFGDGATAFLLPLCIDSQRSAKRLCWLAQELSDYQAPLLAPDFSRRIRPDRFLAAWGELQQQMQRDPLLRHDWIEFEKMPERVGAQTNPFTYLAITAHASGAHSMRLGENWEKFYAAKRSPATRRRDRSKRRHMSEYGEIRFVTAVHADEARRTLQALIDQKSRSLARKGIPDIFAQPGHREFFLDVASNPNTRQLVHISRLEIGSTWAAANLGIVFRDCYYHVLASFADCKLSRYGPGALHLRQLMAHAISLGLKRFDFTIGDEPYKLEWSDRDLNLYDYTASVTWRGWPAYWFSALQRRVKRFIKQTPLAWRLVSRARSAIGALSYRRASRPPARDPAASRIVSAAPPVACVMGDMDLLRPLTLAGIRCAVVTRPDSPVRYSRFARSRLIWDDHSGNPDDLVEELVNFGKAQIERPVLFYEEDTQLLMVSRFRERLAPAFRFVVGEAALVEDLVDKGRFQALAERHGLPVQPSRRFHPAAFAPKDLDLRFPIIIKPLTRLTRWNESLGLHKALAAPNLQALQDLWPQLLALDIELLAQEFVPGAETRIESYHCYVDHGGAIAGEFTGQKIRTYPLRFGHTTALEITQADDVRRKGRAIVERLALSGVAKLDFKRDARGDLRLLEINPRFNLWHHAGAVAGVNIPALVYFDLAGLPRPPAARAKSGVRWCRPRSDFSAARDSGVPLMTWLSWTLGCEAKSSLAWNDPLPLLGAIFRRAIGRYLKAGRWRGLRRNSFARRLG